MTAPAPCDRCGRVECPRPAAQSAFDALPRWITVAQLDAQRDVRKARNEAQADCDAHRARLPALYATERAARLAAERRAEGLATAGETLREALEEAQSYAPEWARDKYGAEWMGALQTWLQALTAHAAKGE